MIHLQKQIKLIKRPVGLPTKEDFEYHEVAIGEPTESQLLVRTVYISVDPYLRGRMNDVKSYIPPFELDSVITSGVIGQVVTSKSTQFKAGDLVMGSLGWQQYSIVNETDVRKIDTDLAPASAYLSVLGMTGLTAYFGLLDIGKPQAGETVVVSGASGAVGSTVGQIAKIKDAKVVGIVGSDEKVNYLLDELRFDGAVNYKSANFAENLKSALPNGVDVYYENVGGAVGDEVMKHLNRNSRIPVCGAISAYNLEKPDIGP